MDIVNLYGAYAADRMLISGIVMIPVVIFTIVIFVIAIKEESLTVGFISIVILCAAILINLTNRNDYRDKLLKQDKAAIVEDSGFRSWVGEYYPQHVDLIINKPTPNVELPVRKK